MLDNNTLFDIGFRFCLDSMELMTPYGEELSRRPHYYSRGEENELYAEQENVQKLIEAVHGSTDRVNALMRLLMPVKDIRRSIEGLECRTLNEVELFEVKRFLLQLELIAPAAEELCKGLSGIKITALPGALEMIDPDGTRSPSFYVSDRFHPELARIRRERRGVDERIKRDGLTDELSALRTRLAAEQEDAEQEARGRLCAGLKAYAPPLLENAVSIGRLDYALAKARLAATLGAVMPKVGGARFDMRGMTNPKFAAALAGKGRGFVPVSLELDEGSTVITGANMGGKSIAIKTLALNVQLAMCGFAVFAEAAELPFIENIALLSEDREDALSGLSSFGGEMRAFDTILKETDGMRSLVLLDEFARGTNPHEGAALVRAAVRLFNRRKGCYAVVATHFDGIARLASRHYQVAGLRNADPAAIRAKVATGTGSLADFMDYGLYPVAPDEEPPRDAITIIHALGVTSEFTDLIDI
ncbi:MAG: hypothetical protein II124_03055 [Clostridia bacterium]|nr:hypothetical protein [Clostridia bacterium]